MAGDYSHTMARSDNTRRRAPSATNTQAHQEPSTIRHYTAVDASLNPYFPAPAPSIQDYAYQHPSGSYLASPYQSWSHHTGAGNEYLPQQQSEPQSSTGSERTSWRADTQSFAAATSSISTPSDHWNLRHLRMMDSSQERFGSPLPFTIDRLESLQHRSNEASPRTSLMPGGQSDSFWDSRDLYVNPASLQLSERFQSQDGAEPWSSFNSRCRTPDRGHTTQEQRAIPWSSDDLDPVSTALLGSMHGASIQPEHPQISEKAFNSDIKTIMDGLSNSQILESNLQHLRRASREINHPGTVSPDRVAFQYRLDRAETPQSAETDVAYCQQDNLVVWSPDCNPSSPSTDSSRMSMTSFSQPTVLYCSHPGCGEMFRGIHRRGSLNRHVRRKHRGSPGDHPCAESSCDRTFNRSDSRLKHYRKHHPWLSDGLPVPRGSQSTQSSGSSRRPAGRGAG